MNNEEKQDKREAPWWRDGMIVFAKVSGYIAIPIIVASFVGKYLDEKYNTGSLMFYCLIIIAFISTMYLIWREMRIYKKKLDSLIQKEKEESINK